MKKTTRISVSAIAAFALAASLAGCTSGEPAAEEAQDTTGIRISASAEGYDAETSTPAFVSAVPIELTDDGEAEIPEGATVSYWRLDIGDEVRIDLDEGAYELGYVTPINADGSLYRVADEDAALSISVDGDGRAALAGEGASDEALEIEVAFEHVGAGDVTGDELASALMAVTIAARTCPGTEADADAIIELAARNVKANPNASAETIEAAKAEAEAIADSSEGVAAGSVPKTQASAPAASAGGSGSSGDAPSASAPSAPAHVHSFTIPVTQTQQVLVQAGYGYFMCSCGYSSTASMDVIEHQMETGTCGGYSTVSVPPVYESQTIIVGYQCACGAMG